MDSLDIKKLQTEQRNPNTLDIDIVDTLSMCKMINNEDKTIAYSVEKELASIASVIDKVVETFKQGGRLIYTGAGTSGRIGLIDAVECRPTYSCDDEMVQCVMAGGKEAFVRAKEGAEDSKELAVEELKNINLSSNDMLIGIAASGRTPYVIGAIEYANSLGCNTASISTVKNSKIGLVAKQKIEVLTGPEPITGSTRMKSGTAQKMICNMITTCAMVKMGKVYSNLMIDVKATNEKLHKRAFNIVKEVTNANDDVILNKLDKYKNAKMAIVSILLNIDDEQEIKNILEKNDNNLRKVINK